jgi:hypothetical protein
VSSESSETNGSDTSGDGPDLGISDDQLPEDLQPGDDNPLASPADEDVPDDLLAEDGGHDHSGGSSEGASSPSGDGAQAYREDAPAE